MILDIDHHSGIPIYRQIIDQVREKIMAGVLKEGDQLTPVRELSVRLSINPMTASKAYSAMEAEGLLERRRGIGLFVVGVPNDEKERAKESIVEGMLEKVVMTAIQFGMTKKEIQNIINTLFTRYQSEKRDAS